MKFIANIITLAIVLITHYSHAADYHYQVRETVASIAERSNASIAINGGFFEMKRGNDGIPSRTLVIDGKIYNLRTSSNPILKTAESLITIQTIKPKSTLKLNNKAIPINNFNRPPLDDEIIRLSPQAVTALLT